MSENQTDKVTVTLKADGSAPWIVIHAATTDEAHAILGEVYSGVQSLAQHAATAGAVLTNEWVAEKTRQQASNPVAAVQQAVQGQVVQQPQAAQQGAFPVTPRCTHGDMVRREGTSAKGPWGAFFCPTPKGTPGQCDPIFDKRK